MVIFFCFIISKFDILVGDFVILIFDIGNYKGIRRDQGIAKIKLHELAKFHAAKILRF